MKRSLNNLAGFSLKETDGEIGKVDEFYFDDISWTIRYLIIKTGNWLSGRKVLISPKALLTPDWENEEFPVKLTKSQIEKSPDIDTEKPVSRQHEEELYSYYAWDPYWGGEAHGAGIFGAMPGDLYDSEIESPVIENYEEVPKSGDRHLRSTSEVEGYKITASDGEIGKVVNYIVEDSDWKISYLVVDTGNWLNSRKVILSTKWITGVKWDEETVVVNVSMQKIKNSPSYEESQILDDKYENDLNDYYSGGSK